MIAGPSVLPRLGIIVDFLGFLSWFFIHLLHQLYKWLLPAPHKLAPQRRHCEYSTPKKNKVYGAIDTRGDKSLKGVYQEVNIPSRVGRKWRKERRELGSPSTHRIGQKRPGRPLKLSDKGPLIFWFMEPRTLYELRIMSAKLIILNLMYILEHSTESSRSIKRSKIQEG